MRSHETEAPVTDGADGAAPWDTGNNEEGIRLVSTEDHGKREELGLPVCE